MSRQSTGVDPFSRERFQEALNEEFVLRAARDQELALKLIAVQDLNTQPETGTSLLRKPFSAVFRGPTTPWAVQHTYDIENERLGRMQIFVVPLGPDSEGMIYEAIFS